MRWFSASANLQPANRQRFVGPVVGSAIGSLVGALALFALVGDGLPVGGMIEAARPRAEQAGEAPREVLHKELAGEETISTKLTAPEFWDALNAVTPGERGAQPSGGPDKRKSARPMPAYDSLGDRRIMRGDSTTPMYRTVCVRTCDGFFWPISFASTDEGFARDQKACESSCGSDVKLFRYRSDSGAVASDPFAAMQDMAGQPYTALKTAYLFRTSYNDACKCKAHPWEAEAQSRHKSYAAETAGEAAPPKSVAGWADPKSRVATAQSATERPEAGQAMAQTTRQSVGAPVPAFRTSKAVGATEPGSVAAGSAGPVRSKAAVIAPRSPEVPHERVVMLHLGARLPIAVRVETPPARRILRN